MKGFFHRRYIPKKTYILFIHQPFNDKTILNLSRVCYESETILLFCSGLL